MVVILDKTWVGKVIIVTGASSGIGEAIAERLVAEGMKVVGLARRKDRLDQLKERVSSKKGEFYGIQTDLAKEDEILKTFKWVKEHLGPIHAIINNAGAVHFSLYIESDTKKWTDLLQVNVIGLSICMREAIKSMRENKIEGHIININSVLGHRVLNFQKANMYIPAKHALTAINEVVRQELAELGSKIKVTSISPGVVGTEMMVAVKENIEVMKSLDEIQPRDVAESVVYVLSTPPSVLVSELIIKPVGEVF